MNNNIKQTNKENIFVNVLQKIVCNSDCKEVYYLEALTRLSILFFDMVYYDLKQHYVCCQEYVEMKTIPKKMQQEVQRLLKITIKHAKNDAIYVN